jgi:hypothetical protein
MAVGIFIILIFFDWLKIQTNLYSFNFIMDAFIAIAGALGWVGSEELHRGGHGNIRGKLKKFTLIWTVILFVLVIPSIYFKIDFVFHYCLCLLLLFVAAPFPVALYMNRNQNKSSVESTITDAS